MGADMTEFGIFDVQADGFIDAGLWSKEEADKEIQRLISEGAYEDTDDVKALELCPEHDEQPRDTCEECATDEEPDDEDDD